MSRRIVGYENGRPIWSENEPARAVMAGIRGSMVVGEPTWEERVKAKARAEAEREKMYERQRRYLERRKAS